jgi:tetratricopeptide (TPR) repeat protein
LAYAFYVTGKTALVRFALEQADDDLQRARLVLQKNAMPELLPLVLADLGLVHFWLQAENRALGLCRQAVELAQKTQRPLLIGQTMLARSQVAYYQGKYEEALRAVNEAVELVRMTSPYLLAALYLQRAKIFLVEDRFGRALSNLHLAEELYTKMEDVPGRLRLYLLWGRGYAIGLDDWEAALVWLDKARAQLAKLVKIGGTAVVESVQLRLGLACVAFHTKQWAQAEALLAEAETEATAVGLKWWLPHIFYWQGKLKLADNQKGEAEALLLTALTAVSNGGNPEQRPLILLEMALLQSETSSRRWQYLEMCLTAISDRTRHRDKMVCLQKAAAALSLAPEPRQRQMAVDCLAALSQVPDSQ